MSPTSRKYDDAPPGFKKVFCRYRKDPRTGKILDARKYGIRAWCLLIPIEQTADEVE